MSLLSFNAAGRIETTAICLAAAAITGPLWAYVGGWLRTFGSERETAPRPVPGVQTQA